MAPTSAQLTLRMREPPSRAYTAIGAQPAEGGDHILVAHAVRAMRVQDLSE
jgi:hypothetical protein